jgi:hypothetical protein
MVRQQDEAAHAVDVEAGLAAKAAEFREGGQKIYAGGDDPH